MHNFRLSRRTATPQGTYTAQRTLPWHRILGLAAVAASVALAGCVPGQVVSTRVPAERTDPGYVHLVPITPQLVATQAAADVPAAIPPALLGYHPQPYEIGPGDTLYITVWNHPELTSPAGTQQQTTANGRLVLPNGTIYYPYAGQVHAAGMTIDQLRDLLTQRLAPYIRNPEVDVNVVNYSSQHVLLEGAFTKTGPQPITTVPLTLAEAMGAAGINTQDANLSNVTLSRNGHVYHLDIGNLHAHDLAHRVYLKSGDRIYLPYNDRQEVYVMGEVSRPLAIRFKTASLTLTQAIGEAGGLNQVTSMGKIYVIRNTSGKDQAHATVFELDADSAVAFALGSQFEVKPGDVVFASAAGITRWNRFMSQLLPLTSALSATAASQYYVQHN